MPPASDLLPFVDEHSVEVEAGPRETWEALLAVVEGAMDSGSASWGARLLGCTEVEASGPRPLAAGSTVPGFRVEVAEPHRLLALRGAHRFSDYALVFRLDGLGAGRTRLRAETRAEFPGLTGRVYRLLVIGTRSHVLVTRRLLASVKSRAERG